MTRLTKSQFRRKFEEAKQKAFMTYFQNSPVDTGYLRSKILLIELENGFQIVNDVSYMQYTEESWHLRSNKVNPNEGWYRRTTEQVFNMIVEEMNI